MYYLPTFLPFFFFLPKKKNPHYPTSLIYVCGCSTHRASEVFCILFLATSLRFTSFPPLSKNMHVGGQICPSILVRDTVDMEPMCNNVTPDSA